MESFKYCFSFSFKYKLITLWFIEFELKKNYYWHTKISSLPGFYPFQALQQASPSGKQNK